MNKNEVIVSKKLSMHNGRKLNAVDQKIGKYGVYYEKYYFFKRTRPNEFRSMTARKDYILPQKTAKGHKEVMQDHTRPHISIAVKTTRPYEERPHKAIQGNSGNSIP